MSAPPHTTQPTAVDTTVDYLLARLGERLDGEAVDFPPLELIDDNSAYAAFVQEWGPTVPELLILALALLPHLWPGALDSLVRHALPEGGELPAFGGLRGKQYRGILPTGQTAVFLLAGHNFGARSQVQSLLANGGRLRQDQLLRVGPVTAGEPHLSGQLLLDPQWLARMLELPAQLPEFSAAFPARLTTTQLDWEDLVLPPATRREVDYLRQHLQRQEALHRLPGIAKHLRRGYRVLFYGPPGTGKTLTATLLGKALDRPVFRVELASVVSKYIGETEKNLAALFARAERRAWVLFFDEADALFGKRSEVRDSKDRYANQEISYLLQRIEDYDGLAILATNFRDNLDGAFARRFEAIVHFAPPGPAERLALWGQVLPAEVLELTPDLEGIAVRYELSGSQIAGAARFALTEWLGGGAWSAELLLEGVRREYGKGGRMFREYS